MDPVNIEILGVDGVVILWILTAVSMFFFVRRITKIVGVLKKAKPENRLEHIKAQIMSFIKFVLGQKRLFNERSIGLPHFLFFWGFVFYALSFWWNLIRGLLPFLQIPYADDISIISLLLEISGVLVLLSIIVAVIRRVFFPPEHLQRSFDAAIILSLIAILMITLILGQSYKNIFEPNPWNPLGSTIAVSMSGMSATQADNMYTVMWWIHMITVLFFLAYIPYSKHMHLLASPFNVLFSNSKHPADLTIKSKDEDIAAGASKWNEFTWKDLLNCFSCAECGRCDRVCPAVNSGMQLSPRKMLHEIKEHLYESGFKGKKDDILLGEKIHQDELWQCTSCMSCMQQCPVLNEHLNVIVSMRRYLINQGDVEQTVQDVLQKMMRYGNSFGQSDRNRAKWTTVLDFQIKDARKEEVEYLWLTGDYAAFDARLQSITQKTAQIFNKAGVDFGILYEAEKNSGNDVRRIGEEGLFEILKNKNTASMQKANFKKIITTDPHTYNTIKNEYALTVNGNGKLVEVYHYTEIIEDLIGKKKISVNNKIKLTATYHDPCYLGRYNGIYNQPRKIIDSLGINLVEMKRNKAKSYCCGAGGGRIWMEDKQPVKERPSESRIREAVSLKGVSAMIVACPKDIVMFQDAVKTTGNEEKLAIRDISELVWESFINQ